VVITIGMAGAEPPVPPPPPVPPVPGAPSTQALLAQCWVDEHACPQLPQFGLLVVVSTHAVPHTVWPPEQPELQALLLQTWLAWHVIVQLPQWVASDATQDPLHSSSPGWHLHWLFWQVRPVPEHGMPQPPQLFESDEVSTHSWPQAVSPEPQALVPPVPPPLPLPPEPACGAQAAPMTAKPSPRSQTRAVFISPPEFPGRPKVISRVSTVISGTKAQYFRGFR
jgi:hypothetical protein